MPEPAQQFGSSARDLGAIRRAVEEAASVGVGLWLSYLFVFFYIGIAAGSVTHKDLLLENPVKLPFLGVELPLVAFFLLAPLLFIVSHGYTLMHFVMLAGKVGLFDEELNKQLPAAPEIQDGIRRELPSNIFVQLLAGPQDVRHGKLGMLLTAVAWITLVIGPVLLLLLIQIQFLPYHEKWVTGAHRIAIVADVVLLWLLWPAVLNRRSRLMWRLEPRGSGFSSALSLAGRYSAALAACFIPLFIALAAATFPGERLDDWIGNKKWIPLPSRMSNGPRKSGYQPQWTSLHDLLFNLPYDSERRRRKSPFSNTLVLPGFDALEALKISGKDLGAAKQTIDLRGRHLEGAIFAGAGLPKAYFGNAHLEGASFYQAKLQGAGFYQAQLQGADLYQAQAQGSMARNFRARGFIRLGFLAHRSKRHTSKPLGCKAHNSRARHSKVRSFKAQAFRNLCLALRTCRAQPCGARASRRPLWERFFWARESLNARSRPATSMLSKTGSGRRRKPKTARMRSCASRN
jgi:hypothetical protein